MTQKVTGCWDCPFFVQMDLWDYCHHPATKEKPLDDMNDTDGLPITPEWCSLKSEPITIEVISAIEGKEYSPL